MAGRGQEGGGYPSEPWPESLKAQQQKPSFWQRVKAAFHSVGTAHQKEQAWVARHPIVILIGIVLSGEGAEGEGEAGGEAEGVSPGEAGGATTLQTGGNTIGQGTANALNEHFGKNLSSRDWGRAVETLKRDNGLPNNLHGAIKVSALSESDPLLLARNGPHREHVWGTVT